MMLVVPLVQIIAAVSVPVWMALSYVTSKRHIYFFAGAINVASGLLVIFVETPEAMLAVVAFFATSLVVVYMVPFAMLPDVIENDFRRTGRRREGMFTSLFAIAMKLSSTVAVTISNAFLKEAGYAAPMSTCGAAGAGVTSDLGADLDQQPKAVLILLRMLIGPIPGCFILIAIAMAYLSPGRTQVVRGNSQTPQVWSSDDSHVPKAAVEAICTPAETIDVQKDAAPAVSRTSKPVFCFSLKAFGLPF